MVEQSTPKQEKTANKGLSNRHIAMISLGGTIGAGLFVGSSAAINTTGPAVLLAFLMSGVLVMCVMRMLVELVLGVSGRGSFIEYIRAAHGDKVGFTSGWLYWFFWVVVMGSEAIAGAILLQEWIPLPIWLLAIVLIGILEIVNFAAPSFFGECEFWLSAVKVFSIIFFVLLGLSFICHLFGHPVFYGRSVTSASQSLQWAWNNFAGSDGFFKGFFPNGVVAVFSIVPTTIFTMMGSEITTVAAAETEDPDQSVARVTKSLGARVTLFYISAILIILFIVPWHDIIPGKSPFVAALNVMHIPGTALIMDLVVLSAVLSCLNSSMYITSRIASELALKGDAPAFMRRRSAAESPKMSVMISCLYGMVVAFSSIYSPNKIFAFLLNCSGGVILLIYGLIVTSYIVTRKRAQSEGQDIESYTFPLFPYLNYATVAFIVYVFAAMLTSPTERTTAISTILFSVFFYCFASYFVTHHKD